MKYIIYLLFITISLAVKIEGLSKNDTANASNASNPSIKIDGYVLPEYLSSATWATTPLPDDKNAAELVKNYQVTYPKYTDFAGWEFYNKRTLKDGVEFFLNNTNKAFRKAMWFDLYSIKNDLVFRMEPNSTKGVCGSEEHCKGERFQEEQFFQKGKDINRKILDQIHTSSRDPVAETQEILDNNTKVEGVQHLSQKQTFPRLEMHNVFVSHQKEAQFIVSESDGPKVQWIAEKMPAFFESECQACKKGDKSDEDQFLVTYFKETTNSTQECGVCNATRQDVVNLAAHYDKIVKNTPMFTNSPNLDQGFKNSNEANKFPFVDRFMMNSDSWQKDLSEVNEADKKINWGDKESKAFFRGYTGGENSTIYDYTYKGLKKGHDSVFNESIQMLKNRTQNDQSEPNFPRLQLALNSLKNPDLIDSKFATNSEDDKKIFYKVFKKKQADQMFDQPRTIEEHLKYKYLLSIDGKTASWKRPEWIMASNSALFKTTTPFYQWFYDGLKPFENYIPVRPDFADLEEKIKWAKAHDDVVNQIAQNGKVFADKVFGEKSKQDWEFNTIVNYARQYSMDVDGKGFKPS